MMPAEGPCRDNDAQLCRIRRNFTRQRVTGPSFPLAVFRCTTHVCSFTVYPPGYVPYARHILVSLSPSGEKALSTSTPALAGITDLFSGTYFQSALDAAAGFAWKRDSSGGTERWWADQRRDLSRQLRMLGIDPAMSAHQRESVTAALDIDHLFLNDCVRKIESQPGYRSRGNAITAVLKKLAGGPCILERLLVGGYLAGLWGFPLRFDGDPGVLRSLPFPESGSRSPPT